MKRLLASKRSVFALLVLVCSTLLLLAGCLTGEQWIDLTKLLVTTLIVGHTVSHAVEVQANTVERHPNSHGEVGVEDATSWTWTSRRRSPRARWRLARRTRLLG